MSNFEVKTKQIMKKLLVIVCVLLSSRGFSQSLLSLSRFSFGLKAGVNYSNYTNADFATDAFIGFHAGALVSYKISNSFSIQEEFLFSSQGAKVKSDVFGKDNVEVDYVTVPFVVKYRTAFGLYIEAGPQTGVNVKDNINNTTGSGFAKKLDLAFVGGLGYQTKFGLGIGVRYVAGLSSVGNFDISNVNTNFRTNVAQASIFYI